MARCIECVHYGVCAREGRMVQIDEHTWDEYNAVDNVEEYCKAYMPKNVAPIADTVKKMQERFKERLQDTARQINGNNVIYLIGDSFIDRVAKEILEGTK